MSTFAVSPEEYLVRSTAQDLGVDPDLAARVAKTESGFDPSALSPKGARGVMQLMPSTAKDLGVDAGDSTDNIRGGVLYFKQLLDRYGGDRRKALAAYNAGPERVDSGQPLPAETQSYIDRIAGPSPFAVSPEDYLKQAAAPSSPSQTALAVPGMERLGGVVPRVPAAPIPAGLQTGQPLPAIAPAPGAVAPPAPAIAKQTLQQPLYMAPGPADGLIKPGTIDLTQLPVANLGGQNWGTVRSASREVNGQEVLYPTIVNGKPVSDDEAFAYAMKTGRNLGTFTDGDAADVYAQRLHEDWQAGKIPGVRMPPGLSAQQTPVPAPIQQGGVPGMERLGGTAPPIASSPAVPIQQQPLFGTANPPQAPSVQAGGQERGFGLTRNAEQAIAQSDPGGEQFKALMRETWKGFGGEIPKGNTPAEQIALGMARAAAGAISPENLAFMMGGEVAGAILKASATSEQVAKLLAENPAVRKAIDLATAGAIHAGFSGYAAFQGIEGGKQAVDAFNKGDYGSATEYGAQAAASLVFAALGIAGARRVIKQTAALYPAPEASAGQAATPEVEELLKKSGATAPPTPAQQESAAQTAEVLRQAGQHLAAQSWQNIADWDQFNALQPIDIGGDGYVLERKSAPGKEDRYSLKDSQGKVVVAGSKAEVRDHIQGMIVAPPESQIPGERAATEASGAPGQLPPPGPSTPPAESPFTVSPEDYLKQTSPAAEPQSPAAQTPVERQNAGTPEIKPGSEFQIGQRKLTIQKVGSEDDPKITYTAEGPTGKPVKMTRPLSVFQSIVSAGSSSQGQPVSATQNPQAENPQAETGATPPVSPPSPPHPSTPQETNAAPVETNAPVPETAIPSAARAKAAPAPPEPAAQPGNAVNETLTEASKGDHPYYGIRVIPDGDSVKVGQELEPSYRWDDGEPTDEQLPGTSVLGINDPRDPAEIREVLGNAVGKGERAQKTFFGGYSGDQVALVGGPRFQYGEDEGEWTIPYPKVLKVWDRGNIESLFKPTSTNPAQGEPQAQTTAPAKEQQTEDIITGTLNPSLTPEGKADAEKRAQDTSNVTEINSGPMARTDETAQIASQASDNHVPVTTKQALGPWNLGEFQGKPQSEVDAQINRYISHPDQPVPGGTSFNAYKDPLIGEIQKQVSEFQPGQRILNSTHSIGVQTVRAWIANGAPADKSINLDAMLDRGKLEPTALLRIDPRTMQASLADNTEQDGIYLERHADTPLDSVPAGRVQGAETGAKPAVSPPTPPLPSAAEKLSAARAPGGQQNAEIAERKDVPAFETEHTASGTPVLRLNDAAYNAVEKYGSSLHNGERWMGLHLNAFHALDFKGRLKRDAAKESDPAIAEGLNNLAAAIGQHPSGAVLLRHGAREETKAHELVHHWQTSLGPGPAVDLVKFSEIPEVQKVTQYFKDQGLNASPGNVATEVPAHLAANEHGSLGLTKPEAARLWDPYVQLVREKHGAEAAEQIEALGGQRAELEAAAQKRSDEYLRENAKRLLGEDKETAAPSVQPEKTLVLGATKENRQTPGAASKIEKEQPRGTEGQKAGAKPEGREVQPVQKADVGIRPGRTGEETTVLVPGEATEYRSRYGLRELADLRSSHHGFSFQKNPEYPYTNDRDYTKLENQKRVIGQAQNFNPRYLITDNPDATNGPPVVDIHGNAIGGNSRVMTMQRVYQQNGDAAARYREMLANSAPRYGLDAGQVREMKEPVLVREVSPEEAIRVQHAITDLNKTGTAALGPSERALVDSRRVSPETLDFISRRVDALGETGTLNQVLATGDGVQIVNRLIGDGAITEQDRSEYIADDKLTPEGKNRINRLMIGRFFSDVKQFDDTPPSLKNKLEKIVAPLARIEQRPDWDVVSEPIREAIALLDEARSYNLSRLEDVDSQAGMFGKRKYSPEAYQWGYTLKNNSGRALATAFRRYAESEALSRPGSTKGMFAAEPIPQPEAYREAFSDLKASKYPAERPAPVQSRALPPNYQPTEILERFTNEQDGIEATVAKVTGGFSVAVKDTDAGEYYPVARIFPTREQATEEARMAAAQQPLLGREEERQIKQAVKSGEDKLLGARLTAQMKSGMAAKPAKLKAAKTRSLFDEPEGPEQTSLFSRRPVPGFYSQLERTIEEKMPAKASAPQVLGIVRNPQNGVKPDELKWSDFDNWVAKQSGPVTKQDALDYLKANGTNLEEVVHSNQRPKSERIAEATKQLAEARERLRNINRAIDAAGTYKAGDKIATVGNAPSKGGYRYSTGKILEAVEDPEGTLVWEKAGDFGGRRSGRSDKFVRELMSEAPHPWVDIAYPGYGANRRSEDNSVYMQQYDELTQTRRSVSALERELEEAKHEVAAPKPKFGEYTLPGGKNYRELLLTLPPRSNPVTWKQTEPDTWVSTGGDTVSGEHGRFEIYDLRARNKGFQLYDGTYRDSTTLPSLEQAQRAAEQRRTSELTTGDQYHSAHWDERNVLAHIRLTDRKDSDGKKVLMVEEIQSDWHQEGKRKGYSLTPADQSRIKERLAALTDEKARLLEDGQWIPLGLQQEEQSLRAALSRGVPAAPFAKSWPELAFRRALRYAAENGYDRMAWTTGEQQAERYDLSKQVDELAWNPDLAGGNLLALKNGDVVFTKNDVGEKDLEEYAGKEVAQRLAGQTPDRAGAKRLSGIQLRVGGEGMKGFYDQIIPAYANKYGKKWGAKVGETTIGAGRRDRRSLDTILREDFGSDWGSATEAQRQQAIAIQNGEKPEASDRLLTLLRKEDNFGFDRPAQALNAVLNHDDWEQRWDVENPELRKLLNDYRNRRDRIATVHSIDITPSMRESVMRGQPLFGRKQTVSPHQMDLFGERATTRDDIERPPQTSGAFEADPASIRHLRGAPPFEENNPQPYWQASESAATKFGNRPALLVNAPAMDVMLRRVGTAASGLTADDILGVTLTPRDLQAVLTEALIAHRNQRPGGFDEALVRLSSEILNAIGAKPATGAEAKAVDTTKPLIVIQTGPNVSDEMIQRAAEEEFDHATQMDLPRGFRGLPVEILDSRAGQIAADRMAEFGYPKPDPDSAYFEQDRAVMTAEIGARLMRGGRWDELGLTVQEARELAEQYIKGLQQKNGLAASAIIDQTHAAIKSKTTVGRGSQNLASEQPAGVEGAQQLGRSGTGQGTRPAVSGQREPLAPQLQGGAGEQKLILSKPSVQRQPSQTAIPGSGLRAYRGTGRDRVDRRDVERGSPAILPEQTEQPSLLSRSNPYEKRARLEKSVAMAEALDQTGATPAQVREMTDEQWKMSAGLATALARQQDPNAPEVYPPHSDATKKEVIGHLKLIQGIRAHSGERGSAPMLGDLNQHLIDKFGGDAPKANYSGLGSLRGALLAGKRIFLPGKQLAEVEKASKPVFRAALRAAGSESYAATLMRASVPAIRQALKGSDHTWEELELYYVESRLRGLRDRWNSFADQAAQMTPGDMEDAMKESPDGSGSAFLSLLGNIEGRQGLAQDLGQTAAALAQAKDWDNLGKFLTQSFRDAAARVAVAMEDAEFEDTRQAVAGDPKMKEADRLYGELLETPMAESHSLNEGVFSDSLGPAGRYFPLMAIGREQKSPAGRRLPYRKPSNQNNSFATGLSESYDISMDAFARRLSGAIRGNNKAALIEALKDSRWAIPEGQAFQNDQGQTVMEGPDGNEYLAVREESSPGRTLIQGRKITRIPAHFIVMPKFVNRALKPILAREPMDPNSVVAVMRWANNLATKGPLELIFHTNGVMGALYANTPFLGDSLPSKVLSAPIAKWFDIRRRMYGDLIAGKMGLWKDPLDPTDPENVKKLLEMSKAGALPAKSGKITYSKEYAEETGAKLERASFGPMLYGPKGLDARARVLMYDIWKAAYPKGDTESLHHFVNQIGNYIPELQGEIEKWLKHMGVGPFATAGMTRVVNGIHTFTGTGPGPGGTWKARLQWWLNASAYAAVAVWIIAYKELTDKWPMQDKLAKLFMIPVQEGRGIIGKIRHTKLGDARWGKNNNPGYINFSFYDNPLAMRGARAMGLRGALETSFLGGTAGQAAEAAEGDILNTLSSPALGPAARAAFVGITGDEPYITGFRDYRTGRAGLSLMPAVPPKTPPGLPTVGARALSAAKQLNSLGAEAAENLGGLTGLYKPDQELPKGAGNWWMRSVLDLAAPGLFANSSNPYARRNALRQQQRALGIR